MHLMRSFIWMSAGIFAAMMFLGWRLLLRDWSLLQFGGVTIAVVAIFIIAARLVVKPLAKVLQELAAQIVDFQSLSVVKSSRKQELDVVRASISLLNASRLRIAELEGEKRQLTEALQQATELDPLTQLLNRRTVQQRSEQLFSLGKRNNAQSALILLNLDHFKEVNDKHSHAVGDMVLTNLAQVLKEECRGADLLARTGDEEFLVLGLDCNAEQAKAFAERLRERIHRSKFSAINGQKFRLTASFGVACAYANELENFEALFAEAGRALHVAKLEGRNRVVLTILERATQNFMRQKAESALPQSRLDRLDALTV